MTGMHGDAGDLGVRVAQLTFVIYDSVTGRTRIAGVSQLVGATQAFAHCFFSSHLEARMPRPSKSPLMETLWRSVDMPLTLMTAVSTECFLFSLTAADAFLIVAQAAAKKQDGGLYGLTFYDVAYRTV